VSKEKGFSVSCVLQAAGGRWPRKKTPPNKGVDTSNQRAFFSKKAVVVGVAKRASPDDLPLICFEPDGSMRFRRRSDKTLHYFINCVYFRTVAFLRAFQFFHFAGQVLVCC